MNNRNVKILLSAIIIISVVISVFPALITTAFPKEKEVIKIHVIDTIKPTISMDDFASDRHGCITIKSGDVDYYISRFGDVILREYEKFGVLPSIHTACAILANAGCTTPICSHPMNNYYNILPDGTFSLYYDTSMESEYLKFETAWESCRAYTLILRSNFEYMIDSNNKSYQDWLMFAYQAEMITHEQLCNITFIIENYKFYEYDI